MIAGNHDYIKKNSYYRTFSWAPHVHMICSQEIDCVELDRIQTAVYGCSYHSREIYDPVYDHAVPEGRQKYEILLAHGGIPGIFLETHSDQEQSDYDTWL